MGKHFSILKRAVISVLIFALFVTALPVSEALLSGVPDRVLASLTYTSGTEWEKYGNYYFYNQMSKTEQDFYDALNARCLEFMTGEEDAQEYTYKNVTYYLVGYVSSDSLTIAQMVQIAKIFKYNNPQYYFLSTMIFPKTSDNAISFTTYTRFASSSLRKTYNSQVQSAIRKAQSEVSMRQSEKEKVKVIHDYIIDMVDYQKNVGREDAAYSQSIFSVFGDTAGGPVCSGYAGAFMTLCNANGIDCISVTSDMHQWNKVRIDDTWYNVDLTWDDLGTDESGVSKKSYTYFCRSNAFISMLDETDYHTIEDFWTDFLLPECNHDSGSDSENPGELYTPVSSAVSPGYTAKAVSGTSMFSVSLYTATGGADIYYTTDGRTPEIGSTKSRLYTKPFKVLKNTLIRAVAVHDGYKDSIILKVSIADEMSGGTSVRLSDCNVSLSKTKFKYTGTPIRPKVLSVTYKDTTLTEGVDYEITSYDNNTAVGTAKIILTSVTGSRYKGTKTVNFSISAYILSSPVVSVKNVKKGVKLSWNSIDSARGYIIERKTAKGKYKRLARITDAKTLSYTDKTAKVGKLYYYRVTGYSKNNEYRKTYCKPIAFYRLAILSIDSLSSPSAGAMRISWSRDAKVSGYQVKYVTGKEGRLFNVDKKYMSATVTGLDKGKKYSVYVRSYRKKDGKKIYSKWSAAKKIVISSAASAMISDTGVGAISTAKASGIAASAGGAETTYREIPAANRTKVYTVDELLESSRRTGAGSLMKGSLYYTNDWEQYTNYYYYNKLTAAEKKLYRALDTVCSNYLTGADRTVMTYNAEGVTYHYLPMISLNDGEFSISPKKAAKVYFLFRFSNPQYFFTNSMVFTRQVDYGDSVGLSEYIGIGVYATFASSRAVDSAKSAILATMQGWDSEISSLDSDYEKVLKIHDLIAQRVSYNTAYGSGSFNDESAYTQSVYSALAWSGKKTVCAGYSFAFMMLCNKYGIDAVCLTSELHQWNAVRIEDQWYAVDLTWDDDPYQDGSLPVWYYFFLRKSSIFDDYDANEAKYTDSTGENHSEEWFYDGYEPPCIRDTDFSVSDITAPGQIVFKNKGRVTAPTITFDGTKVTIKASSKKDTIYYTTDGTAPSVGSSKSVIYSKSFKIKETAVVRAIAVRSGYTDSKNSKLYYTLERPVLKSASSSGGRVTVKWKKESGITGHEISVTIGKKTKIIRVKGAKKVSKVIRGLTSGKKYKIKVRSYIKDGRTMYYSAWSKTKKITVR